MAGTINLALTQQFDSQGRPLSGGLLYFFVAATTTPQTAFQDLALTIPHPNPIVLDASGRVPMFYLADGNIKIRLTDENGVVIIAADNLLVIGPSTGGGGGGQVDPTTIVATGDIKARFGTGILTGFVRCNGRTIGSATSGATERANADCQALFEYLWTASANLPVTPSRGASANADWTANKQIGVPDLRGRTMAGMDDMGATAAARLTAAGLGVAGTVLGNAGAVETVTLATVNLPVHAHVQQGTFSSGVESAGHTHGFSGTTGAANSSLDHTHNTNSSTIQVQSGAGTASNSGGPVASAGANTSLDHTHNFSGATGGASAQHTHQTTISGNTGNTGSGSAFSKVQPTMVLTFYIKL